MAKYSVGTGHGGTKQAMSTSYKTLVALTAATGATTLRKAWINYVSIGTDSTPTDAVLQFKLDRQTTVGTGTTVTPSPLETTDAAALITATVNHTAEPTVTAATQLLDFAMNTRASYHWIAPPGSELVVPAVNAAGIGARAQSPAGYTGTVTCLIHFWE